MLAWWKRRAETLRKAQESATDLLAGYGAGAYEEARQRARDARTGIIIDGSDLPKNYWDKVRIIIAHRTGKIVGLDTATRYLEASSKKGA